MKKLFIAIGLIGLSFTFSACEDQTEEVLSEVEDVDIIMTTDENDRDEDE